jgi:prephenate dehydrogenase
VIDVSADSAADAARGADVVLIAVPVLATANALHAAKPGIGVDSIITDVGSTKQSVLAAAQEVFGTVLPKFVAAHPIAGTEKSGVANALPDLFRGHRVILTPHAQQDVAAQTLIAKLWEAVGARVVTMEPARHDAIFAATSHLPHLLAFASKARMSISSRTPVAASAISPASRRAVRACGMTSCARTARRLRRCCNARSTNCNGCIN